MIHHLQFRFRLHLFQPHQADQMFDPHFHPTPKAGPKGLNRFDSTLHAYALARLQRIANICCFQILPKSGSYPLSVLSTDSSYASKQ